MAPWLLKLLLLDASAQAAVWQKITFRTSFAAMISFILAVVFGRRLIRWLNCHFKERIVSDSPTLARLHSHKQWTPTMGGLLLVAAVVGTVLLLGDFSSPYLLPTLLLLIGFASIGAYDDLAKLRHGRGIQARSKFVAQTLVATLVAVLVWHAHQSVPGGLSLTLPGLGGVALGMWFIPLSVLVLVGSSNAVNLTDGLDGLAGGCLLMGLAAMGVVTYVAGHANLAAYVGVLKVPGAGELTVAAGAAVGAVLGFLWFNCHPAQVFMGDTGSLPLGGLLGLLAVVARQELLLVLVGGVFVAEALSVIVQVGYFKLRHRRLLRCAPLHHHFQFLGWPESQVVVRFWIAAALCAVVGLGSLKLLSHAHPAPSENVSLHISPLTQ